MGEKGKSQVNLQESVVLRVKGRKCFQERVLVTWVSCCQDVKQGGREPAVECITAVVTLPQSSEQWF